MKASLKFRDEQKPLLRAKVPINVLSLPFQSGVVAGESKELSLQLSTAFESGPSLKLAYKPNDSFNPFSLVVKTGAGKFGSPIDSPLVMSAELNLVGDHGRNPSFFVHFKPRFGDFGIRKKQSSTFFEMNRIREVDSTIEVVEKPNESFEFPGVGKIKSLPSVSTLADSLVNGVEMSATTHLPMLNFSNVKFQWGLRFPAEMKSMITKKDCLMMTISSSSLSFQNVPFLVMNKISVGHGGCGKASKVKKLRNEVEAVVLCEAGKDDVSAMCVGVRHQLEALRDENGMLRKAVEELRSEIASGRVNPFGGEIKHKSVNKSVAETKLVEDANAEHMKY